MGNNILKFDDLNSQENSPTLEQVKQILIPFVGENPIEGDIMYSNDTEKKLDVYEVSVTLADGTIVTYTYNRKGRVRPNGQISNATTSIVNEYTDSTGMPFSGFTIAEFINNEWVEKFEDSNIYREGQTALIRK